MDSSLPSARRAPLEPLADSLLAVSEQSLKGKVALVTGASSGLGRAFSVAVPQSSRPVAGQQLVPELGHPGHSALLSAKPVIDLHVRYARVRPVAGHWQLELIAPEGARFNSQNTQGKFYDVVIDGKALSLFFVLHWEKS